MISAGCEEGIESSIKFIEEGLEKKRLYIEIEVKHIQITAIKVRHIFKISFLFNLILYIIILKSPFKSFLNIMQVKLKYSKRKTHSLTN